jgi:tetratricopeptide (TPR) repeat protein
VGAFILAVAVGVLAASGAEEAAAKAPSGGALVGDRGRKESLEFEGNKTFTREQILRGISLSLDFQTGSRPNSPFPDFAALLKRLVRLGYQRAGFGDVDVEVTEVDPKRVRIRVNEGPRYLCGEIILSGVPSMTNGTVQRKITEAFQPNVAPPIPFSPDGWRRGKPAPMDEDARERFSVLVMETFTSLNYWAPSVQVRLIPSPAQHRADLSIHIANEGVKGTVEEIEITGLHTNSRAKILEHLGLKAGMPLQADLAAGVSNQLWRCGRFFHHDVVLEPLADPGRFKLKVDLVEVRDAPPIERELSPKEMALLKLRERLVGWKSHPEDFVLSISSTNSAVRHRLEVVLSQAAMALTARDRSAGRLGKIEYAIVFSDQLTGYYSVLRKTLFAARRSRLGSQLTMQVRLPSPQSYGSGNFSLGIRLGAPTNEPPLRVEWDVSPAVFVSMAHWMDSTLENDVLTLRSVTDDVRTEIRIDAVSGRLLGGTRGGHGESVELHLVEGAFSRVATELAELTSDHSNCYLTNHEFSSWATFMVTELMQSPLAEYAVEWFGQDRSLTNRNQTAAPSGSNLLALARGILSQKGIQRLLEPFDRLGSGGDDDVAEYFVVPSPSRAEQANSWAGDTLGWIVDSAHQVWPRDTWPWAVFRAEAFVVCGADRQVAAELDPLVQSVDLGPVGALAAASVVADVDLRLARRLAERGRRMLRPDDFRRDYLVLLQPESMVGELAANGLDLLTNLNEAQLTPAAGTADGVAGIWLSRLSRLLRERKNQPALEAAWPAFAELWEATLGRQVETALTRFLPQVEFLTNTQALFERGLTLIDPDGSFQDFDEAVQCFRKAASQGHAGAELEIGHLYERGLGVREDFEEAMRCYRKAAERHEPHSACAIGGLYLEGKGVRQDLDEAAKWLRLDAQEGCARAQFGLGLLLDKDRKTEEAVPWFRRAAEAGTTQAQAKLGELLGDGLFVKQDYVEACQWLSLAAAAGDKLSAFRLRRVKAKLTLPQITQAEAGADAVRERLELQQKKKPPTWKKQRIREPSE